MHALQVLTKTKDGILSKQEWFHESIERQHPRINMDLKHRVHTRTVLI